MSDIRQGINVAQVDLTAQFPLGLIADDPRRGFEGNKIKYVKFGAAFTAGWSAKLDVTATLTERHATVIPTTNANETVEGIRSSELGGAAINTFGWIVYQGLASATCAATIVAGALLITTANDGELDDTALTPNNAELQAILTGRQVRALSTTTATLATVLIQG